MSPLRWMVGSPDGLRGAAWRLWSNPKGDFYLATQPLGHITKASFHADGRCSVGFDARYANEARRRFPTVGSRHWRRWQLPIGQVVRAVQILLPASELTAEPPVRTKGLAYLPPPSADQVGITSLFIADNATLDRTDLPRDVVVVGECRAATRSASVIYIRTQMEATLQQRVRFERHRLAAMPGTHGDPGGRAILWDGDDGYERRVLELAVA